MLRAGVTTIVISLITACASTDATVPRPGGPESGEQIGAAPIDSSSAKEIRIIPTVRDFTELDTAVFSAVVLDYRGNETIQGTIRWETTAPIVSSSSREVSILLRNGLNQVVARIETKSGPKHGTALVNASRRPNRAVVWAHEMGPEVLPLPQGALEMRAAAVNDAGQVAGSVSFGNGRERAFMWSRSGGVVLFGSDQSRATGISAEGRVVGFDGMQPFTWTADGGIRLLSAASVTEIHTITSSGVVVGASETRAVTWTPESGLRILATPDGADCAFATSANTAGDILGYGGVVDRAFGFCQATAVVIWRRDGTVSRLGTCDPSNQCPIRARFINDRLTVAGERDFMPFTWAPVDGMRTVFGEEATVMGLSEAGVMVGGIGVTRIGDEPGTRLMYLPYRWAPTSGLSRLDLPAGFRSGTAGAISNSGIVAGWVR